MKRILNKVQAKIQSGSRVWKVGLYQAFLLVAAATGFVVLVSPSTFSFFAFELGVALAGGFFLKLRGDLKRTDRFERESTPSVPGFRSDKKPDQYDRMPHPLGGAESDAVIQDAIESRRSQRVFLPSSAVFVMLIAVALLDLSRSLYVASIQFYTLIGCAAGALAINVQVNGERRAASLLIQIMLLAVPLKFYFVFLNPYLYTSDNYLFYLGLRDLSETSFIPSSLGHYFFFPGFATYAFAGVQISGIPLELFGIFGFLSQIAMLPLVYLIGRHVANPKVGLFAAIFVLLAIYAFLFTHASPTHYGLALIFLGVYAAIRLRDGGQVWFIVFWLGAIGAMLSHPVNALVFGLILTVRAFGMRIAGGGPRTKKSSFSPVLSYALIYGSYLAFIAATQFDLFVRSFFVGGDAPPLTTSLAAGLERSFSFIVQSALAPLAIVLPAFFAGYAVLARARISRPEHGFLVSLGGSFLFIPGLEFVGENFPLQSSRMLIYFVIPFAFLGAHGLVDMTWGRVSRRRTIVIVLGVFMASGFLASSSYLTLNDGRAVYTDVPFSTAHITGSALAGREFLNRTPLDSIIYMESGSLRYFDDSDRARDALPLRAVKDLIVYQVEGGTGFVAINQDFLPYGVPSAGGFYDSEDISSKLQEQGASLLYDSGRVKIYYAP